MSFYLLPYIFNYFFFTGLCHSASNYSFVFKKKTKQIIFCASSVSSLSETHSNNTPLLTLIIPRQTAFWLSTPGCEPHLLSAETKGSFSYLILRDFCMTFWPCRLSSFQSPLFPWLNHLPSFCSSNCFSLPVSLVGFAAFTGCSSPVSSKHYFISLLWTPPPDLTLHCICPIYISSLCPPALPCTLLPPPGLNYATLQHSTILTIPKFSPSPHSAFNYASCLKGPVFSFWQTLAYILRKTSLGHLAASLFPEIEERNAVSFVLRVSTTFPFHY